MSHPFDARYALPFPSLPVVIYQVGGGAATSSLPALLDTGADATLVPAVHLEAVQSDEIYTTYIRSHWGERRPVSVYLVDLDVAGERLPAVEVVADEYGNDVLLGRNVLNKLILLLDGRRSQTDVLTRRPLRW